MLYKNYIDSLPSFIHELMMNNQEKQGNPRDINTFYKKIMANISPGGFNWNGSEEGIDIWVNILGTDTCEYWEEYSRHSTETLNAIEKLKEMYPHLAKSPVNIFV